MRAPDSVLMHSVTGSALMQNFKLEPSRTYMLLLWLPSAASINSLLLPRSSRNGLYSHVIDLGGSL